MKWGIDKYFYYPKRDRQVLLVLITLAAMTLLVIYFAGDPSDIKAADGAGTTAAADSMASKAGQPAESLTAGKCIWSLSTPTQPTRPNCFGWGWQSGKWPTS